MLRCPLPYTSCLHMLHSVSRKCSRQRVSASSVAVHCPSCAPTRRNKAGGLHYSPCCNAKITLPGWLAALRTRAHPSWQAKCCPPVHARAHASCVCPVQSRPGSQERTRPLSTAARVPGVGASASAMGNGPSAGSSATAAAPVPLPPGVYRPMVGTFPQLMRAPLRRNACRHQSSLRVYASRHQAPLRVYAPAECA